ncbi:MAG: TPM domain-containing protein [Pseudomonadota bacterium]
MAVAPGAWSQADEVLPQIKGRITDQGGLISSSQKHLMYQVLAQHESGSHHHVVLLTAKGAGAELPQVYAKRIWQAWQRKDKSRSVLFVLFKQQKVAAIIAGSELSKKLDVISINAMIDNEISTPLKAGDFDGAALAGVKGIVGALGH